MKIADFRRDYIHVDELESALEAMTARARMRRLGRHLATAAGLTLAFELGGVAEVFPNLKHLWRPGCGRSVSCL